jgi:excisionase family DNA binding protein
MEPLALSPLDAAAYLSISKRTLTRLIAAKRITARKSDHQRTLIDVASLKAYYATLPIISKPAPLPCAMPKAKPKPKKAKRRTRH